jgi:hypothetical protein
VLIELRLAPPKVIPRASHAGRFAFGPSAGAELPSLLKQIREEGAFATPCITVVVIVLLVFPLGVVRSAFGGVGFGPVDDLIETTSVDPDASARRAAVHLDSLAISHHQLDIAYWAVHTIPWGNSVAESNLPNFRRTVKYG